MQKMDTSKWYMYFDFKKDTYDIYLDYNLWLKGSYKINGDSVVMKNPLGKDFIFIMYENNLIAPKRFFKTMPICLFHPIYSIQK